MRRSHIAIAVLVLFTLIAASAQAQSAAAPSGPAIPASFDDRSLGWTMQFIQGKVDSIGNMSFTAVLAGGEKRRVKLQVTDVAADAAECHISFHWKGPDPIANSKINMRENGSPDSGFYLRDVESITLEPGEQFLTRSEDSIAQTPPMDMNRVLNAINNGFTLEQAGVPKVVVVTEVRPQFTALLVHLPHNKLSFFPFQDPALAAATAAALSHATKLCGSANTTTVLAWTKPNVKDAQEHPRLPGAAPKVTEAKSVQSAKSIPAIDSHPVAPEETKAKNIEPPRNTPSINLHPAALQPVKPLPAEGPALDTGKNYALVIGIDDYPRLHHLNTAVADADAVGKMLQKDYGFDVQYLHNSGRYDILAALDKYRVNLPADSNLIIYYAGHGQYLKDADEAYWIPADGEAGGTANWIPASQISSYSRTIPAKHILVISDSCYSGTLLREASTNFRPEERSAYVEKSFSLRSRNLMSSGSNEPVTDGGGNGHSVFADVLLNGLGHMDTNTFTGSDLFKYVEVRVAGRSEQLPQYGLIRNSGDEFGDFVFVRRPAR